MENRNPQKPDTLVLWDFDGTLYQKDSFIQFIRYTHGNTGFYFSVLKNIPSLVLWKLGVISNSQAKEKLFSSLYRGWEWERFLNHAREFQKTIQQMDLVPDAWKKFQWHKEQGHRQILVSASFTKLLEEVAKKYGLELIATELEVVNGKVSGRFQSPNCYGDEKKRRVEAYLTVSEFKEVYAYGDSKGDFPMFSLASKVFFKKYFDSTIS